MGSWRPNPGAMNLEDPMATDAKLQHSALPAMLAGLSEKQLDQTPMCNVCGWRKGGLDSWNGRACRCGHTSPTFRAILADSSEVQS